MMEKHGLLITLFDGHLCDALQIKVVNYFIK
jgi:hypothetical protein